MHNIYYLYINDGRFELGLLDKASRRDNTYTQERYLSVTLFKTVQFNISNLRKTVIRYTKERSYIYHIHFLSTFSSYPPYILVTTSCNSQVYISNRNSSRTCSKLSNSIIGGFNSYMAKKLKIPSIFKNKETKHPWQWLSCKQQPKTHSFRADDKIFETDNLGLSDPSNRVGTPKSCFTYSEDNPGGESVEMIIRGVQSERLIFEPSNTSSSILDEAKTSGVLPLKESIVLAIESDDPYRDFKKSMEEMVETHGLKDWKCLEALLGWYLKMNERTNQGFIVGAFVDLLRGLASSCSNSTNSCSGFTLSSFSSSSRPSPRIISKSW